MEVGAALHPSITLTNLFGLRCVIPYPAGALRFSIACLISRPLARAASILCCPSRRSWSTEILLNFSVCSWTDCALSKSLMRALYWTSSSRSPFSRIASFQVRSRNAEKARRYRLAAWVAINRRDFGRVRLRRLTGLPRKKSFRHTCIRSYSQHAAFPLLLCRS